MVWTEAPAQGESSRQQLLPVTYGHRAWRRLYRTTTVHSMREVVGATTNSRMLDASVVYRHSAWPEVCGPVWEPVGSGVQREALAEGEVDAPRRFVERRWSRDTDLVCEPRFRWRKAGRHLYPAGGV